MDAEFETYISVDVETAGPAPERFALLSIGACRVADPDTTFTIELQPDRMESDEQAMRVAGLTLEGLLKTGVAPAEAMARFAEWLERVTPEGQHPVFVAFNAPFDWMFVSTYFSRYLGTNPFGYAALDIKAYAMGARRCRWKDTSFRILSAAYGGRDSLIHNALQDALDQARLFRQLLMDPEGQKGTRI